jgi:hypothetical protein
MPETYAQKRERWQKLANELPHNLGSRISLRNVPIVAALSSSAQNTLAAALDGGLPTRQVSKAAQVLKETPDIDTQTLLARLKADTVKRTADTDSRLTDTNPRHVGDLPDTQLRVSAAPPIQTDTLSNLADLLQICFPEMVRASAEALAKSPSMEAIYHLLAASQVCFGDVEMRSDVTVIVLAGLIQQLAAKLDEVIVTHPNYQRALQNSGVQWKRK